MRGAAWTQVIVRSARVLLWLAMMVCNGLTRTFLIPSPGSWRSDPLLTRHELRVYLGQTVPQYLAILAGWLIFELQLVLLTNIQGVDAATRAAGADWVNLEGALAAVQSGWIKVVNMRTLKLLGMRDKGAPRAFVIALLLASGLVAALNVPLLLPSGASWVGHAMSNDPDVGRVLSALVWILVVHAQTRIVDLSCGFLLLPIGFPKLRVGLAALDFWLVAAPLAIIGSLTDVWNTTTLQKVQLCTACTSIGQLLNSLFYCIVLSRLDWEKAARVIESRANTDRTEVAQQADCNLYGATTESETGGSISGGHSEAEPIVLVQGGKVVSVQAATSTSSSRSDGSSPFVV